jgi:N-acyl homoserine lactone hydrolase
VGLTVADIRRIDFGYFIRPSEETGTGRPRVEPVLGYAIPHPAGAVLFDTGIGEADPETDEHYRLLRRPVAEALHRAGVAMGDIRYIVNCHLHFDHCGGNPAFRDLPIVVQARELADAREAGYTVPAIIDFPGARYEEIVGEVELVPGVLIVPTPGHTSGHQSAVIRCQDGTVVCAGQSHDAAREYGSDLLALTADAATSRGDLPAIPDWIGRVQALDPRRIVFAHDLATIDM